MRGGCADASSGSFTLANPRHLAQSRQSKAPLANKMLPALVSAVFALERSIAPAGREQASTSCAVNRRAEFAPHVDSGTGLGQSLSLLVALGDFQGGELCVEGETVDVRYEPLEFDGWKKRHWTLPFRGERYSLVFFSAAHADTAHSKAKAAKKAANNLDPPLSLIILETQTLGVRIFFPCARLLLARWFFFVSYARAVLLSLSFYEKEARARINVL